MEAAPPPGPASDLPLDAHLHTDLSPDSDVPIDVYAAAAAERGIAELLITDHVDFDARDPAFEYSTFEARERSVREAAERWAGHGVAIRFGAELTFNRRWENDIRAHVAAHRYDYTIGSVHDWPDSPYRPERVATWARGRGLAELVGPYLDEVTAAARSGLFDTIGHLDVVKRYLWAHAPEGTFRAMPELLEPALEALVETGTALEVNTSGLRQQPGETYPTAATVARFRELGGERVTTGSDAHRPDTFAFGLDFGYRAAAKAGFRELTFRRGTERATVAIPARFRT
ncbi:MAG: histidinol-phosphatase HisJ family protein [Chloroflexota bacterium]